MALAICLQPIGLLVAMALLSSCERAAEPNTQAVGSTKDSVLLALDFESATVGDFPSPLERQWGAVLDPGGNAVGAEQHHGGAKALRLSADPSGCYSASAKYMLPSTPDKISVQFYMLCEGNYSGGCHQEEGVVEFVNRFNGANADTRGGLGFHVTPQRSFRLLDTITDVSWEPMTWYKVVITFDRVARRMTASVNDRLVAERMTSGSDYHYIVFGSGDATVWVDDVRVVAL